MNDNYVSYLEFLYREMNKKRNQKLCCYVDSVFYKLIVQCAFILSTAVL